MGRERGREGGRERERGREGREREREGGRFIRKNEERLRMEYEADVMYTASLKYGVGPMIRGTTQSSVY